MESAQGPGASVDSIRARAIGDRARLDFLLELSHQLRTPAGIIDGYLSLARQGEMSADDAIDIAGLKARELCSLLDALLTVAAEELKMKDVWPEGLVAARSAAERAQARNVEVMVRARALVDRLNGRASGAGADRSLRRSEGTP